MMFLDMVYDDGYGIVRVLVVGTFAYAALVFFLRISGKRTLAKLNAFDLVVTVALGSTLSSVLLDRSIPLAEGVTALAILILLQFVVTFCSVRSESFARYVRSRPTLLVANGRCRQRALLEQRITEEEVLSSIRSAGGRAISDAESVVLESDGTLSVSFACAGQPQDQVNTLQATPPKGAP